MNEDVRTMTPVDASAQLHQLIQRANLPPNDAATAAKLCWFLNDWALRVARDEKAIGKERTLAAMQALRAECDRRIDEIRERYASRLKRSDDRFRRFERNLERLTKRLDTIRLICEGGF